MYLKDTSRPDPWVPEARARELKVTLWYPTQAREGQRAQYMTPKESELILVLSPGFTMPMSTLTALAEELASRGYAVAGIDHTHESYATTFPGGRIATCVACDSDSDPGFDTKTVRARAADVSFVLDELTGSFADIPLLAGPLGVPLPSDLSVARSVEITRAYVRAFFDLHLHAERQPLLDRPSSRYPEVKRCTPDRRTCN